jgi:hypothetical protein
MAEGIRDKVAIIGMDCTRFGELWNKSVEDLRKMILAEISVKSHRSGALTPKAHLRREVTAGR